MGTQYLALKKSERLCSSANTGLSISYNAIMNGLSIIRYIIMPMPIGRAEEFIPNFPIGSEEINNRLIQIAIMKQNTLYVLKNDGIRLEVITDSV